MDKFSPRDHADLLFVRDMLYNCVKHKPDAWCLAMIPVNISMVCNHCKNLLEEVYIYLQSF